MRLTLILFVLILVLLLTGVIPVPGGLHANAVYTSPVLMLLFAVLSGSSLWCCLRRKFRLKQLGFYLVHIGFVIILAGAFAGYLSGKKGMLKLTLSPPQFVSRLMTSKGGTIGFGFDVAAADFQVKFYPPVYDLYRELPPEQIKPGKMPFCKTGEFDVSGKTVLMLDDLGSYNVSNLWNEARQEWVGRKMIGRGAFLNIGSQTPSFFGVTLLIRDGEQAVKLPVSINHPAGYKGWRFYLTSYDNAHQRYVVLSARCDPGRVAVIVGIWMLIIGTFVLCFRREGATR
jgi:hypothetical protein